MKEKLLERFLTYVKIHTTSDEESETYPSTACQWDLLNLLKGEMEQMGLAEVKLDEYGYLTALLPANTDKKIPTVAFIAHVDTSPDVSGENVKPQIHESYDGNDLILPGDPEETIRVADNPNLPLCKGHTIITTDGTTLLGADDKAGIAEILTAVDTLIAHPEIKHGPIKVAFTPDEEIGKGTEHFDVAAFGADYAYTLDGADLGEIENETFTASSATVTCLGHNVHPGYAKGKMVNAMKIAAAYIAALPADTSPETTEEREGYIHPHTIKGDVSKAQIHFIIRDFTVEGIEAITRKMEEIRQKIEPQFPKGSITLETKEQYKNMVYKLNEEPKVVEYALEAVKRLGIKPELKSIRGGTDGAQLCYKGLLTPNLFAGGQNFHSKREWVSLEWMEKASETIIELVKIWAEE